MSHLTSKKVPALSLVAVALVGMVIGVLATSITITQNSFTGETGTFNNNTGTMTVTDQGLSILASSTGISINTTATFGANGSNANLYNGATFTAGHWIDTIVLTDTTTGGSHTITITIKTGTGVTGTTLASFPVILTLTGPGSASTGTITAILDLGTTSITAPMTLYVTST